MPNMRKTRCRNRGKTLLKMRAATCRNTYDSGGGERRWRHQDFGCYGVELMGLAPRVACAEHGVVVAQVPWAEPGSRFTRDFEMECAWLTAVASRKTVGGFLRIEWRTAGDI
ncbi:helix-turn-helix domain-containing protein, partial [Bifidobacterium breve]|uniref:helix-turn-helix domain-containing protein n=1 Tax=Bifidobacterium breve TaxID=1685 RepID=UPI0027E2F4CB